MTADDAETLGSPDIELGGFQMWVHGRAYPESSSDSDYNTLDVTIHCSNAGCDVWGRGCFFNQDIPNLEGWLSEIKKLYKTLKGEAILKDFDPSFSVLLTADPHGHIGLEVSIEIGATQRHWFQFEVDQTFLSPFIKQIETVLLEYPVRRTRNNPCSVTKIPMVKWLVDAIGKDKPKTNE